MPAKGKRLTIPPELNYIVEAAMADIGVQDYKAALLYILQNWFHLRQHLSISAVPPSALSTSSANLSAAQPEPIETKEKRQAAVNDLLDQLNNP